jgi:hypothetical protein
LFLSEGRFYRDCLLALLITSRQVKGDANYRRLIGDALWPHDTPFAHVLSYFAAPLLALRTLKSEVCVGLAPGVSVRPPRRSHSDARGRLLRKARAFLCFVVAIVCLFRFYLRLSLAWAVLCHALKKAYVELLISCVRVCCRGCAGARLAARSQVAGQRTVGGGAVLPARVNRGLYRACLLWYGVRSVYLFD